MIKDRNMWLNRRNIRSVIDDGDDRRNGDDDADDEDDVVNDEDTGANSKKTTQRNKREEDDSINNVDSRDIENDDTRPLGVDTDEPNESTSNENGNETGNKNGNETDNENGNENGNDKWYDRYAKARKQLSTVRIVLFVGLLLVNLLVLIYGVLFFTFDAFGGEAARPMSATTGTNTDRTFNDKQVVPGRIDLWRVTGLVALLNSIPPLVSLTVTTDTP